MHAAIIAYAAGMDFADALHLCSSSSADTFATFDRTLARAATRAKASLKVQVI